jgi:hypothetical protein
MPRLFPAFPPGLWRGQRASGAIPRALEAPKTQREAMDFGMIMKSQRSRVEARDV